MRSEVRQKLLVEQCLMNVWRKRMFQRLVGDVKQTAIKPDGEALDLFRVRVDYTIENAASAIALSSNKASGVSGKQKNSTSSSDAFAKHIQDLITEYRFLSTSDQDRAIVESLKQQGSCHCKS